MTASSTINSAAAFAGFLEQYVRSLDVPCRALWRVEDAVTWRRATTPIFLHAWARWLESTLPEESGLQLEPPSWSTLAEQLLRVRDARPPRASDTARDVTDAADVCDRRTFARWLHHLGDECIDDDAHLSKQQARGDWDGESSGPNPWAHGVDLDGYLDAWSRCLADSAYHHPDRWSASSWQSLADLVTMGQVYE